MKIVNHYASLMLICTTLLLGSCSTFEEFQNTAGSSGAAHPMWGSQDIGNNCPHRQEYMGSTRGAFPFSMRSEYFNYCHKCGRYVRGRQ
jgi:hypothetical protein